jgi:DNA topoisomerase-3
MLAGRLFEVQEVEDLLSKKVIGPLQGFRSKMGRPFAGILRLNAEFKVEFDFGQNDANGNGEKEVDFTGQEPLGKCPKCGNEVFENGMYYVCRNSVGKARTCDFRSGKVILQQTIDRPQMVKLLTTGKTDLLPKFISKKGRPFEAFLVVEKDKGGKVVFEFPPRKPKAGKTGAAAKKAEPEPKVDFTGQESIGKCPICEGRVFQSETHYLCENTQKDTKPCKFKAAKTILQQPLDLEQMKKLLENGRTDLLNNFISKAGRPFPAYLIVEDKGKVGFEFPPRDE